MKDDHAASGCSQRRENGADIRTHQKALHRHNIIIPPLPRKIRTWSERKKLCPVCGGKLANGFTMIPGPKGGKVAGKRCFSCACIYVCKNQVEQIEEQLSGNDQAEDFSIDDRYYSAKGKADRSGLPQVKNNRQRELHQEVPTALSEAIWCTAVLAHGNQARRVVIVTSKKNADMVHDIYHYTDGKALDVLTAIALDQRRIMFDGVPYFMEDVKYGGSREKWLLRPGTMVTVLEKKNGGYFSPDPAIHIVDALVFAENTHRLELLKVSYDARNGEYFVDPFRYREFKNRYGFPYVQYKTSKKKGGCIDGYEMRPESTLHQLGYNVGQKDDLKEGERQAILARCVDMGYMAVHEVISLLLSLIQRNGYRESESIDKWRRDVEFLGSYQVDTEQLAFVSQIKKMPLQGNT